ncbi:MAG: hypothetical protein RR193_01005, partial [Christensenellaceae bacterium]
IYMIVTICVVVLAGILFIKLLPWLILAGVIAYGIIKIRASECAIKRINNLKRYQILLNVKNDDAQMIDMIFKLFNSTKYQNVLTGIDINPSNMA